MLNGRQSTKPCRLDSGFYQPHALCESLKDISSLWVGMGIMEEPQATDLYVRAEKELTKVACCVQRREGIDLDELSSLAADIGNSVQKGNQLVVQALAGPSGSPLITNLINVSILASKVAAGLGYYGQELHRITLAGLVHDIGLFTVPQSLLTKAGRLTKDERTLIEQHPELGYHVIRKLGDQWEWLAEIVRQAHERWNGRGYPNHIKGREINELAQIIGAVDVFDALVSPRPYRRRFFPHEAVRELIVAERYAFPREIMKVLLEQLSAYPLGTLVRLTTGEIGAVVDINTRYPLRPIVEITAGSEDIGGQELRRVDLSRSPLVSIVETLESPSMTRLLLSSPTNSGQESKAVPPVSDHFSSLLESLDALAEAIQEVVEAKLPIGEKGPLEPRERDRGGPSETPTARESFDPGFEKEVVGLFALEAHEWLAQIHSALKRLGEGANGTTRPRLYGIMLQGLTNLAKSAATVHLTSIEDMALNLLPVLQDVGGSEPRSMGEALASLEEGIKRIATAVCHVEGRSASELPNDLSLAQVSQESMAGTLPIPVADASRKEEKEEPLIPMIPAPSASLLHALRDLQQVRSRSMQPARDVLETVIMRADQESEELSARRVREILEDLDRLDERFLQEVTRRVPVMSEVLNNLQESGETDFVTASQLEPVVQQVEALEDFAVTVQANMIMTFLQGLRSFLMVAAYRKAATLPQRLATVETRIQALVPMAEQWVNLGRVERAAIAEILPAS
jgi:hypothetical protein